MNKKRSWAGLSKYTLFILIVAALLLTAYACNKNDQSKPVDSGIPTAATDSVESVSHLEKAQSFTPDSGSVIEIFEYTYPNNTANLNENHQIELIQSKSGFVGFYHGTSDDFDEAREGYFPGFFVLQMLDLKVENESITFSLHPTPEDMFSKPIPLSLRTSADAKKGGFQTWENAQVIKMYKKSPKSFSGIVKENSLLFKDEWGNDREFIKK